jgi:hypothetical protein
MMHVCVERGESDRTGRPWGLQHEREPFLPPRFGRRGICAGRGAMPAGLRGAVFGCACSATPATPASTAAR